MSKLEVGARKMLKKQTKILPVNLQIKKQALSLHRLSEKGLTKGA
ncbi:MAG: hypothetical protein Q8928_16070 [Bacteroidota bacterium]|nr:hypothetical protein [Bacteroidota bacterium]